MSASEDWARTRELKRKAMPAVAQEKKRADIVTWCQECGAEISFGKGDLLCSSCAEKLKPMSVVVNPMELFFEARSRERG